MPNHMYECEKCNHSFDKRVQAEDNDATGCPKCGSDRVKRLICSESFMSDASIGACSINAPKGFS